MPNAIQPQPTTTVDNPATRAIAAAKDLVDWLATDLSPEDRNVGEMALVLATETLEAAEWWGEVAR